jgi:DNA ligase-associated metallophosphoesterase
VNDLPTLQVGGSTLQLLPQRAAWLPAQRTLLVADAHIGKAVSFRRLGVPVPGGTTTATLDRLSTAVAATGARRVVFLGDLLHSARSRATATWAAVAQWRVQHAGLQLTLVRGNHDSHAGDPPPEWDIECLNGPLHIAGLALSHHPDPVPGAYVLAGHVHPAVALQGRAGQRLRLPCFHFGPQVGVLPAFGAFTGMHALPQRPGDRVYAIAEDAVRALPPVA